MLLIYACHKIVITLKSFLYEPHKIIVCSHEIYIKDTNVPNMNKGYEGYSMCLLFMV